MPMSTQPYDPIGRPGAESPGSQTPGDSGTLWSPRALTVVSAPKLEKLALNSGTTGGARKMTQNASKTIIAANAESRVPVSVASWHVHQVRDD